jgi:3-oxoadipate enol-lactonase
MRLVFLHGIGGLAVGFNPHITYFKQRGLDAVALNQPGYGHEPIIAPYSFESVARVLYQRLSQLPEVPTVLIGHSMGGMLAQTFAVMNSEFGKPIDLAALVLAQTSPAFGNSEGKFQQRFIADRIAPLAAGKTMADVAANLVPTMVGQGCAEGTLLECVSMMSQVPAATYQAALGALVQFDARPHLITLTMPVLCLGAEYDKTAPSAVMEKLAAKLPIGEFKNLPGLGHLAPLEDPILFCQAIESFLEKANL